MAAGDFTAGRFANVQHVSGTQIQTAGLVSGRLPLNPSVASRRFSDHAVANVPRASSNTQFSSRGVAGSRPAASSQAQSGYHRFGEPGANNRPPQATAGSTAGRQGSLVLGKCVHRERDDPSVGSGQRLVGQIDLHDGALAGGE